MPDKREAIVTAALDLIKESGLAAFTQPRVARRVGLRQSHLTYYFPTRDDLLAAVAEEAVRQRLDALRAVPAAGSPEEMVAALARVLTSPEQTRVLMALAQSADGNEAVRASFGGLAAGIVPLAAPLLEAFGIEVDEAAVGLLQATSTGIAVIALARGAEQAAPVAEHLIHGLLAGCAAARRAPT